MSHEIESIDRVGLRGKQAWHGLGVVVQDDLSAVLAAERFGLCWPVDRYSLAAQSPAAILAMDRLRTHLLDPRTSAADELSNAAAALQEYCDALVQVDSHVANIRTADADGNSIRHLLGVVGADYQVCQNRELAEFTDALAQTGRVTRRLTMGQHVAGRSNH